MFDWIGFVLLEMPFAFKEHHELAGRFVRRRSSDRQRSLDFAGRELSRALCSIWSMRGVDGGHGRTVFQDG